LAGGEGAAIPATEQTERWDGHGTALKPAHEVWWLVRKTPEGAIAENVLRWGTGGLDIAGTRLACATGDLPKAGHRTANFGDERARRRPGGNGSGIWEADQLGRWPANVVLSDAVFGGKSRFFLIPKASPRDRDSGVPGSRPIENNHIAVKPIELMRHLVRLVAPKGGLLLDPFAGSGSTGVAAGLEGVDYLLIEQDQGNVEIARARLGL
jgi:hypothetical protein